MIGYMGTFPACKLHIWNTYILAHKHEYLVFKTRGVPDPDLPDTGPNIRQLVIVF